jgi:hypothetical protein
MKKFALIATFLTTGLMLALSTGCNRFSDKTPEEKVDYISSKVEYKLDLEKNQKDDLKPVVSELVEMGTFFKSKKLDTLSTFEASWNDENFDPAEVNKIVDELSREFDDRMKKALTNLSKFHASLNDEQKAKVSKMLSKHKSRVSDD